MVPLNRLFDPVKGGSYRVARREELGSETELYSKRGALRAGEVLSEEGISLRRDVIGLFWGRVLV